MKTKSAGLDCLSFAVAGVTMVIPSLVAAQEAPRHAVRISGGLEASSNPFLLEDGPEAVAVFIALDPTLFLEEGRNTTVIDGSLRATQYLNEYGTDANGRLRLSTQRSLSERTELGLSASINSTRRSFQDGLASGGGALPTGPTTIPDTVLLDPTLVGALVRSTTVTASGSLERQLTPVSSLAVNTAYTQTYFSNNSGVNVSSASGSLGYGRRVAPQTVVSFSGQFASFNFAEQVVGDANVYSLRTEVDHKIGTRWTLAFGAGVDLVNRDLDPAGRETNTLFAGDIGLCNTGLRTRFCVTARRAAQATAIGGVTTVTSIGANYELRLSRTDLLSFSAQYGRSNQDLDSGFVTAGSVVDLIGATANYRHDLSDRAAFVVALGYSDVSDDLRDVSPNAFVRVGVTQSFGRRR